MIKVLKEYRVLVLILGIIAVVILTMFLVNRLTDNTIEPVDQVLEYTEENIPVLVDRLMAQLEKYTEDLREELAKESEKPEISNRAGSGLVLRLHMKIVGHVNEIQAFSNIVADDDAEQSQYLAEVYGLPYAELSNRLYSELTLESYALPQDSVRGN